jgi:hypothetical protein
MNDAKLLKEINFDEYRKLEKQGRIKQVSGILQICCQSRTLEEGIEKALRDAGMMRQEDLFAPDYSEANAFMKGEPSKETFERHEQVDSSVDYLVYPVVLYGIR